MSDLDILVAVLEVSSRRYPEKPLTNTHMLNIAKMAQRIRDRRDDKCETALEETLAEDLKWGKD